MKPFYQSKTFWFNVLAVLVALAGLFGYGDFQPSTEVAEIIGIAVAAVNLILRFMTKSALTWK